MRRIVRWLPGREWELVLVSALYAGLLGIAVWKPTESTALYNVLITLEFGLPVALGVIAAGLIANDPVLDLLLSVARPASRTLAQRLAAVLGYGLLLAGLMVLIAWWREIALPVGLAQAILIWAAPTALLVGVATVGALLRGRMLDGVALVFSTAGMALLTLTAQSDCPPDPARPCYAALVSPLMTLLRPHDPLWLTNRLLWLGIGCALVGAGLGLVRQEERLVLAAQAER